MPLPAYVSSDETESLGESSISWSSESGSLLSNPSDSCAAASPLFRSKRRCLFSSALRFFSRSRCIFANVFWFFPMAASNGIAGKLC